MSFLNQSAFSARLLLISIPAYVWVVFLFFLEVNLNDLTGWCTSEA